MSYSPWGKIDNVKTIMQGVSVVNTPGHGGIRISERVLKKYAMDYEYLVDKAAIRQGNYLFFEEDCAAPLLLFDCVGILIEYAKVMGHEDPEKLFQVCKSSVHCWYPDYFIK